MIFCNQDILKTITAMSFKLGQVLKDNKWITWLKFKIKALRVLMGTAALKRSNREVVS